MRSSKKRRILSDNPPYPRRPYPCRPNARKQTLASLDNKNTTQRNHASLRSQSRRVLLSHSPKVGPLLTRCLRLAVLHLLLLAALLAPRACRRPRTTVAEGPRHRRRCVGRGRRSRSSILAQEMSVSTVPDRWFSLSCPPRVCTHPVVRLVRDGRLGEDAILFHRPGLASLRRCNALGLHVVVEPCDDVSARRAVQVRHLL